MGNKFDAIEDVFGFGGSAAKSNSASDGPFYRISDIAKDFGLSARALRFYEDKGLVSPKRVGLNRFYDLRDVARLKIITFGRRLGFSLAELQELLSAWDQIPEAPGQTKAIVEKLTSKLAELEKDRVELDRTIQDLRAVLFRLHDNGN